MLAKIVPNSEWAAGRVAPLPARWQGLLLDRWRATHGQDRTAANSQLRETTETLLALRIPLDAADATICDAAEVLAARCASAAERIHDAATLRRHMDKIARAQGIEPPDAEKVQNGPAIARLTCHQWWRRKLRAHHGRAVEAAAIALGYVNKRREIYCSNDTLHRRTQQNARNLASLEATVATNERGQEYTLAELAAKGPANKAIRRAELMTRISGFERIARDMGHAGLFLTMTCPSKFHKWRTVGGWKVEENPRYEQDSNPRTAQAYLAKVWARIRAALKRLEVGLYGFRIAEPQHDGTPHWHFLVFHDQAHTATVRRVVRHYALQDSPNEPGAHAHRVDFKAIDWSRGSAAGYIAKYVAKNIDGYRLEKDLHGNDSMETSARVEAWASTWGIRQFQQVGGPPVGPWRELRRIEALPMGAPAHLVQAHNAVNKVATFEGRENASVAWDHYVKAQGGVFCGRDYRIRLDTVTDEGKKTRYGEEAGPRPVGIYTTSVEQWIPEEIKAMQPIDRHGFEPLRRVVHWHIESTRHTWVITGRARSTGRVSIGQATPVPWTRVNNCTEGVANGHRSNEETSGGRIRGLQQGGADGAVTGGAIHGPTFEPAGGTGGGGGWLEGAELHAWRVQHMPGPWKPIAGRPTKSITLHPGGRTGAQRAAWLASVVHGPRLPTH
jgi:hypothetical protein